MSTGGGGGCGGGDGGGQGSCRLNCRAEREPGGGGFWRDPIVGL